jgi:hypothetical protein
MWSCVDSIERLESLDIGTILRASDGAFVTDERRAVNEPADAYRRTVIRGFSEDMGES